MSTFTTKQVSSIAHLARIAVEEQDLPAYASDLTNILNMVEQMQAVNTDDVTPLSNPLDATQRLRKDEVLEKNQRDKFQEIAPATEDGLYLVPQVIE